MKGKTRALFMPEGTILAHVGRTLAIARELDTAEFEVNFAASGEYADLARSEFPCHSVYTQPRERLLGRLHKNQSAFSEEELRKYVHDEIRLLNKLKPDIVIGDFRASLGISAVVSDTPYVCVTNAVWSQYCAIQLDPPENWLATRILGKPLLRKMSPYLEPAIFRHHARPFNAIREEFGLSPYDNVREAMCSNDLTLFADMPEFFPCNDLPNHCRYIGPVLWEPETAGASAPVISSDRPIVYLTMGSTGGAHIDEIANALIGAGFTVVCTSAGDAAQSTSEHRLNLGMAAGSRLCRLADVVVCHAGNGTVYQALAQGTPIVGVPEFFDQEFNAQRLEALELGVAVRPGRRLAERVAAAATGLRSNKRIKDSVAAFAAEMDCWNGSEAAAAAIARLCAPAVQTKARVAR